MIQTACPGLCAQMLPLLFALACKPDPTPSDDSQPEVVKPQDSAGGDSDGGDSDPPHSEDTGLPCGDVDTDPLRIDACWQLVAAPELLDQASLFWRGSGAGIGSTAGPTSLRRSSMSRRPSPSMSATAGAGGVKWACSAVDSSSA